MYQINKNEIKILTYLEKIELQNKIKTLKEIEHFEILKILINNNVKYTENNNGIFFNLRTLNDKIINEIYNFVNFNLNNKVILKSSNEQKTIKNNIIKNNTTNLLDINYKKYLLNQSIESNGIIKNNINNEEDSVIKKKKDLNSKIKTIKKKKLKLLKIE